jgi:hypothetical protein
VAEERLDLRSSGLGFPDRFITVSANLMCDDILGQGWR